MGVTSDGKWFCVDPVDMPVAEAAGEMLRLRVEEVQKALPVAAHAEDGHEESVEAIHQVRVSCRRAAAAQRAFRSLTGRGGKKLDRWLKRLRRAAGPARDADVLLERLRRELALDNSCSQQIIEHVQGAREKAQRRLTEADAKTAEGGFERALNKTLKTLAKAKPKQAKQSFAEFARAALGAAGEEMRAIDPLAASVGELHQLRIAAKHLRYTIELFHSAADARVRGDAYPLVEELQERLGALNDRVSAQARFQSWLAELPPNELAGCIAGVVVSEQAAAEQLRSKFLTWWLPQRQADLQTCLETLVG
jgi:CHAD domain-containing protein